MKLRAARDITAESTLRLAEEGCVEVYAHNGERVELETLRQIYVRYCAIPADFVLRVTEKGRDALARGRP